MLRSKSDTHPIEVYFENMLLDEAGDPRAKALMKSEVAISTAILILGGLLIVSVVGVQMYNTYRTDQQIQSALQLARDNNGQVEIGTSNSYTMNFNVGHENSFNVAGGNSLIIRVTPRPRNAIQEYYRAPNGQTFYPYDNKEVM